jgi:hypothetical protein
VMKRKKKVWISQITASALTSTNLNFA